MSFTTSSLVMSKSSHAENHFLSACPITRNSVRGGWEGFFYGRYGMFLSFIAILRFSTPFVFAATTKEYAVLVQATVVENPPTIVLSWPLEPKATGYQISRKLRTEAAWSPAVSNTGKATSWTDSNVTLGTKYEYQIKRTSTIAASLTSALTSYGYVCAGIHIPVVDHRGTVILVVDDTQAAPLFSELLRLRDDLLGDGWTVIRHDVPRTGSVSAVKALIRADYDSNTNEVRSVFLFGHVPVARSGNFAPGTHQDVHKGAFPTDVYYGEMTSVWTDSSVSNKLASSEFSECWNVPGDGKFDPSFSRGFKSGEASIDGVELEVGRVDLWGMTSFLPKTETDLLRQYLNKDHAHRHALRVLPRRAMITDIFGESAGDAYAQSAWRSWTSLFGATNVSEGVFATLQTNAYFGYYMNGGGWNNHCDPINTVDFATQDPKAAFVMIFGSHFCDWNYAENILRAPICTTSGLASVYSGVPFWFLHTLSLGGTFGEAALLVQNNFYLTPFPLLTVTYSPASLFIGGVHVSLHGDPTLRMTAVVSPAALTITKTEANNSFLSWSASTEALLGYHIYRAASPAGPFMRLTSEPSTPTNYLDFSISSGTHTYQVKAVRLETTGGGTFINISQAASATIDLGDPVRPILSAILVGEVLELAWPSAALGYTLQATTDLHVPLTWQSVPGTPTAEGNRQILALKPTQSTSYFRLARP